jgi:hypothetical protein
VQVSGSIANRVLSTAQAIYQLVILPAGRFIAQAFGATYAGSRQLFTLVSDAGRSAVKSVYETYLWLSGRILPAT